MSSRDPNAFTPPPPPQYPFQDVFRKGVTHLRPPSSVSGPVDTKPCFSTSPLFTHRGSAVRAPGPNPPRGTLGAAGSLGQTASGLQHTFRQPRTIGRCEFRPLALHSPPSKTRTPDAYHCSIPAPKISTLNRSASPFAHADPKRTPLLSRLLAPGFATPGLVDNQDDAFPEVSVHSSSSVCASDSTVTDHATESTTAKAARLGGSMHVVPQQRYKIRVARFAPVTSCDESSPLTRPHRLPAPNGSQVHQQTDFSSRSCHDRVTMNTDDDTRLPLTQRPTEPSSESDGSVQSAEVSRGRRYSDRHIVFDANGSGLSSGVHVGEEEADSEETNRSITADEDEEVADENGSKTRERSPDSEMQLTTGSNQGSPFPERFHRMPHAYVNEEQALAAVAATANSSFYAGYTETDDVLVTRSITEQSMHKDSMDSSLACPMPEKLRPTVIIINEQPPLIHPRRANFDRVASSRSKSNVMRDYVNMPESSLINWLATAVTAHYPIMAGNRASFYLAPQGYVLTSTCPQLRSTEDNVDANSLQPTQRTAPPLIPAQLPPPPPPYRPHPPVSPRVRRQHIPLQPPNSNVFCHFTANGCSLCYTPFPAAAAASFAVISTATAAASGAVLYFRPPAPPPWLLNHSPVGLGTPPQRTAAAFDDAPTWLEETTCGVPSEQVPFISDNDGYIYPDARPTPTAIFTGVPPLSAALLFSTPVPGHSPKLTTVGGNWNTRYCPWFLPPTTVCSENLFSSTKLGSSAGVTAVPQTDCSPGIHTPGSGADLDAGRLRKENQHLRSLLSEATARLQYVDVLEWHLQRLSLLVESMLASHHRQCELDHQLHGCFHPDILHADPRAPVLLPPAVASVDPRHPAKDPYNVPPLSTCLAYYPVACPLVHAMGSATIPVFAEDKVRANEMSIAGPQPTRNVGPVHYREVPEIVDRTGRSQTSHSAWPRTVSLDRASCVRSASNYAVSGKQLGPSLVQTENKATHKTVRVVDDSAVLSAKATFNNGTNDNPLPFRSVQVTRRQLVRPTTFATGTCFQPRSQTPPSTDVCSSGLAPIHTKRHFPLSSSKPATPHRPIGISLVTRHSEFGEDEPINQLTPHTETLPVKMAVSTMYHAASACHVCLADPGVPLRDPGTQVVSVDPCSTGPSQNTSVAAFRQPCAADPAFRVCDNVSHLGSQRSTTKSDGQHTISALTNVVATEPDGSGSYEGVSLPRAVSVGPVDSRYTATVASDTTVASSREDPLIATLQPKPIKQSSICPSYQPVSSQITPGAGHMDRHHVPCTVHSPPVRRLTHPFPQTQPIHPDFYSPTAGESRLNVCPVVGPTGTHVPRYRPPFVDVDLSRFPPDYGFLGAVKPTDRPYTVNPMLPHGPTQLDFHGHSCGPYCSASNLSSHRLFRPSPGERPESRVHFASSNHAYLPLRGHRPLRAPLSPAQITPRNLTIDSIVSPHLLRRQYCYE
ncbi:hypothetical protein EG68_08201 [Paragonimus skrjabini miyazakii]|uniref:Uncharacterized protein n=1 Tax=Paragonimus skrjabini miyazakii TaxID=59628 RepID=A0A8S9YWD8_9TREM|nr:hypothetical protein EG68_08201 [Paragonimus skrjabini miyazakii]